MPWHIHFMAKKKIASPIETPALLWKRALAFLIDMAIVYVIVFLAIGDQLSAIVPDASSFSDAYSALSESSLLGAFSVIYSFLLLIYFLLLERRFGQSIGKMALKLHVIGDREISFWRHMGRLLFLIPFFPFMLLWIAEPITMLFTENNRRLGDIISKTRVVEYREISHLPANP